MSNFGILNKNGLRNLKKKLKKKIKKLTYQYGYNGCGLQYDDRSPYQVEQKIKKLKKKLKKVKKAIKNHKESYSSCGAGLSNSGSL